jgi:hypothetical protein
MEFFHDEQYQMSNNISITLDSLHRMEGFYEYY